MPGGMIMEQAVKSKRIASVEWIRIFAAICIIMFHFESIYFQEQLYFTHMAVSVEFFLILSGFLLMKGVAKQQNRQLPDAPGIFVESLQFVFKKAMSFYPPYLLAFVMVFILTTITSKMTGFSEIMTRLFHFKWEALLLQMAGFNPAPAFDADYLVGPAWYLSAMLLAMIPVYFLAAHYRRLYTNIIAPVSALFIYCFFIQTYGTIDVGNEVAAFVMSGTLRAFAGLGIGCMCYCFYEKSNEAKWSKGAAASATIAEALCYLSLPCLIILQKYISKTDVFFWVFIFAILVFFGFTGKTKISIFLNSNGSHIASYLGRLSLYIYLFHWFFVFVFVSYVPELSYWQGQLMYSFCVILFSIVMMFIFEHIRKPLFAKKI